MVLKAIKKTVLDVLKIVGHWILAIIGLLTGSVIWITIPCLLLERFLVGETYSSYLLFIVPALEILFILCVFGIRRIYKRNLEELQRQRWI